MTDSVRVTRPVQAPIAVPVQAPIEAPARPRPVRLLGWLAGTGIGGAILIMIGASLVRQDWMYPPVSMPATGPPWELPVKLPGSAVSIALWLAALLAAGGLVAGLVAARRGARGPIRLILITAAIVVAVLAVLPPAGSTDPLDYAAYGRLALLGHNPYVASPVYLRLTEPAFGRSVPIHWDQQVSLYGPAATIEQFLAAKLGGASMARVVLWLKLWDAMAFGAVAIVMDRVLKAKPSARLRAHLLWTINPLLLWDLIAPGHLDVIAAGAGMVGLLAVGRLPAGQQQRVGRAVAAGALIGLAADIKIDYLLFGIGLAWTLRRSAPALVAAGAGAIAVLAPAYAWLGKPAFMALFARRNKTTQDSFYRLLELTNWHYLAIMAALLFAGLGGLLLWRMPPGDALRPAIRPALALSLAWLVVWPYQLPWYDAMIICVLVFYPATLLDWLVLARVTGATIVNMPGDPSGVPGVTLKGFDVFLVHGLGPGVLLAVAVAVVVLAVSSRWGKQPADPLRERPALSSIGAQVGESGQEERVTWWRLRSRG
jgi:hypothetical protein